MKGSHLLADLPCPDAAGRPATDRGPRQLLVKVTAVHTARLADTDGQAAPAPTTGASAPALAKLTEHTEPDFIAETYLASRGQPVSVATAEELLKDGDGRPSEMRQANAGRGRPA